MNNQHAYHCFEPELITFGLQNSNNNLSFLCCRVVQVMGTKLLHKGSFSNIVRRDDAVEKTTTSSSRHVELANHRAVSGHANVCRLLSFETSRLANTLTLELCCTDAYKRAKVRGFTGAELRSLTRDMVAALRHLHACGIMHRDVKPQNVLLCRPFVAKLTDFEYGIVCTRRQTGFMGTPNYMSPEVLGGKNHGAAVDVWGLGVTVIALADGARGPFERHPCDIIGTYRRIRCLEYRIPGLPAVATLAKKIVALEPDRAGLDWIGRWADGKL